VIILLEKILSEAVENKISDVHFEPLEQGLRVRFRKDGFLYEYLNNLNNLNLLKLEDGEKIISRIKVLADLNIAEKRLPQDGQFSREFNKNKIDFRVSTCPTRWGEKIVLRLQESEKKRLSLEQLGLNQEALKLLKQALGKSQGLIIVTGPTGSGKTLSLYSALEVLNSVKKNICTVEDPIEMNLSGVNQVNVQNKIGLDFSKVLTAFLRQDPDVMMVGEIRDLETAQIAVKAAHTGHLVLSTLHTNSALESLTRLSGMGVKAYEVASAISLLIAQRLIRKLCDDCKQEDPEGLVNLEKFLKESGLGSLGSLVSGDLDIFLERAKNKNKKIKIYKPAAAPNACPFCTEGFQGRTACFEVIPMTDPLAELILSGASILDLRAYANSQGYLNLLEAGLEKVLQGETVLEEVLHGVL